MGEVVVPGVPVEEPTNPLEETVPVGQRPPVFEELIIVVEVPEGAANPVPDHSDTGPEEVRTQEVHAAADREHDDS